MKFDPASFRDPDGRVLTDAAGRILRVLSERTAEIDAHLRTSGALDELVRKGLLVESWRRADLGVPEGWAAIVESARVPVTSYPYEWSFHMLRDAAALTLELTEEALRHGAIVKDASAFNILFDGAHPTFIDVSSFERYEDGTPWLAYGQFCDQFLAPLMLEAYRGVSFQSFLRGNLGGISAGGQLSPLLGARDLLRPGVLVHAKMRAMLDRRSQGLSAPGRRRVRAVRLPKQALLHNLRGLRRLVSRMKSRAPSTWADYEERHGYAAEAAARKSAFVERACRESAGRRLALDAGANVGRHARILARTFDHVAALDADPGAVDRLYLQLKGTPEERKILPLVVDLMNPSPSQGWRGRERSSLGERMRPDLALYLALVHHLCLGAGVPLEEFVELVAETSPLAVVEFVSAADPMSQTLLATKAVSHAGYDLESFRALVARRGRILAETVVSPSRSVFLLHSGG